MRTQVFMYKIMLIQSVILVKREFLGFAVKEHLIILCFNKI